MAQDLPTNEGTASASTAVTGSSSPPLADVSSSSLMTSPSAPPPPSSQSSGSGAPAAETDELSSSADSSAVGGANPGDKAGEAEKGEVGGGVEARSSSLRSRLEGGEVVFIMENVAVHPSAAASQRIRGRLRLVQQDPAVYLSWLPYSSAERSNGLDPQAKGQQYAIRAVSLSEIRSIRRQTPTLGWQYVIIVLNTGLAFPPLYFYDGGVRSFIVAVKQHATLIKSQDDPNVYLVNDSDDPLMMNRTLGSMRWQGAFANIQANLKKSAPAEGAADSASLKTWERDGSSTDSLAPSSSTDMPMQVLQGFAGLTRFARAAFGAGKGRGDRVLGGADAADRMPVRAPPRAAESLAQGRKGTPSTPTPPAVTTASSDVGQFEVLDPLEDVLQGSKGQREDAGAPLSHEEWISFLDEEGRVRDKDALCALVFHRGIDPELRREVWKFLLGYYPFDSTYAERRVLDEEKRREYYVYKNQWESVTEAQARRFAKYRERVSRVEKDVVRTDRKLPQFEDDDSPSFAVLRSILLTYSFYNFDLGYCQGMSDLLSPFLVLMGDEVEAFWCFAQFMETMGRNFNRDQTGMHSQLLALSKLMRLVDEPLFQYLETIDAANLFCCFRWLLILFKREFEIEDVLKLWERLWTCPLTKHFHLYVCCAILKSFRRKIFDEQMQFDALLRFVNELSCRVDLDDVLQYAEALCVWAGERGEACLPPPVEEEVVLIEGPETDD